MVRKPGSVSATLGVAGFFVSLTALGLSLWNTFQPADIALAVSSPQWVLIDSDPATVANVQLNPLLKLTCTFSNTGARTGVVEYFVVRFVSDDGTKWLYSPYFTVDDSKWMTENWRKGNWREGMFSPITVTGKQTIQTTYLLFPESGLANFSNVALTPHKFTVSVLTWESGNDMWRERGEFHIDFSQSAINAIKSGGTFMTPISEQQQRVQTVR
jgi:hypothetical protein